jgi:dual specificity tyrosine-phosphorylation-regulated kinase 2/3/4
LQAYAEHLCDYEQEEVFEHKYIYFVGEGSAKKKATRRDATNNYGYDDERGDYQVIQGDHVMFRYEVIDTLGKGSFGQVLRCRDHKTGNMVAVKIIRNKKRFHHQALVEIKVLENLNRWVSLVF